MARDLWLLPVIESAVGGGFWYWGLDFAVGTLALTRSYVTLITPGFGEIQNLGCFFTLNWA